ncbi:MAG: UDP-2,4-diacetamido-2,4,6-trideoxy-beta-L-altropyranose hydrolase, partial [candidate division Zixibacteria bacterium]|nr:UDP-2,4-diacetamido-2,4,6-trideoxy-beta-L-altropyranose hydrolase [candidate division Zixibacteria bacterium]
INYHRNVDNMAEMMARADLAIGGGGTTIWERCCLGLPSLVIVIAQNQAESTAFLDNKGIIHSLGEHENVTHQQIYKAIKEFNMTPSRLREISGMGLELVDGKGSQRVEQLVTEFMFEQSV